MEQLAYVPIGAGGWCRPLIGHDAVDEPLDGSGEAVAVGDNGWKLAHHSMVAEIGRIVPAAAGGIEFAARAGSSAG